MGIVKKQFSTFTVSYADVEIDFDNFKFRKLLKL